MKCPNCGYVSFTETEKCKKCGSLLHKETAAEAAPVSAESVPLRKEPPSAVAVGEMPLREDAIPTPLTVEPAAPEVRPEEVHPPEVVPVPAEVWKSDIKKKVQARRERAAAAPPPVERTEAGAEKLGQAEPATSAAAEISGPHEPTLSMGPPRPQIPPRPVEPVKKLDQQPLFPAELIEEISEEAGEPTTGLKAIACLCDALVVAIPWLVAVFSAQKVLGMGLTVLLVRSWLPLVLLFIVFHTMYDLFFLPSVGVTPGLALFGLRLTSNGHLGAWRAALFSVVSLLSLGIVGAGFIWAIFDPDRRCWHELASSGRLVYAAQAKT